MDKAQGIGGLVIRPLFYEFPHNPKASDIDEQYTFGSRYPVAPATRPGQRETSIYLPCGAQWKQIDKYGIAVGGMKSGGVTIKVQCPLGYMPVFERSQPEGRLRPLVRKGELIDPRCTEEYSKGPL